MTAASVGGIDQAKARMLFIGGRWVMPESSAMFDIIKPSTEEHLFSVAQATEYDVERAVKAARDAFDSGPWPRMSVRQRAEFLDAFAAGVIARTSDFSAMWSSETGAPTSLASAFTPALAGIFTQYSALADSVSFIEEHNPTSGAAQGLLVREPVGVVAAIVPWNAPLMLMVLKLAPALLAGCTVVLKASPEAPLEAYGLAEIAEAIGLPPGVLNVLTADRAVSESLVRHVGIDKVSFTGSVEAGRRIASLCGERIARCTLELGGKSPAIVTDDYDLAAAAGTLAESTALMTGQTCAALTRVIVSRQRHDALVEALVASFSNLQVGDPFDPATQLGPLAHERQLLRVKDYIARGVADGARLVVGGQRPAGFDCGFYMAPTLLTNVDNDSVVARDEIFGPVLCVIAVDDEEDAIRVANDTKFGLNATVFTDDTEKAFAIARRLRSGTVAQNAFRSDFGIAFGGFKQSGIGREGGAEGLRGFLEAKTILLDAKLARSTTHV